MNQKSEAKVKHLDIEKLTKETESNTQQRTLLSTVAFWNKRQYLLGTCRMAQWVSLYYHTSLRMQAPQNPLKD